RLPLPTRPTSAPSPYTTLFRSISFLLIDMATPGVTVRPIANIKGDIEFCEVFFDDVRVSKANLVGEPNKGWTMAKALLGFERLRSEEHTSELQSRENLVCRLLL